MASSILPSAISVCPGSWSRPRVSHSPGFSSQIGSTVNAVDLGNNSVQTLNVNALGGNVRSMKVYFSSSGAVAKIVCPC